MHDSRLIANNFIQKATDDANTLTPMQLLKLVYIAHGWMLGLYSIPMIRDKIQAWKFGPVIPDLYHETKYCGDSPVTEKLNFDNNDQLVPVELDLISQVYGIYGHCSGVALSNLTHQTGTPWDSVYVSGKSDIIISNDIIEEHYSALATKTPE